MYLRAFPNDFSIWQAAIEIATIIIAIASISVALIAADQAQRANQIAVDTYKHTEEKDSNDLKFAQANMISTWLVSDANGELLVSNDSKTVDVIVNNDSKQPIYNVVLTTGTYQGAGQPFLKGNEFTSSIGTVPPGRYKTRVPYPGSGMHIRIESAITFTDVRGLSWLREMPQVFFVRSMTPIKHWGLNSHQVIGSRLQKLNNLWANQPFRSSPWGWCMYCSTQAMLVFGN